MQPHEHRQDGENGDAEVARRVWEGYLTGDVRKYDGGPTVLRAVFGRLPSDPRCKICLAPFRGIGKVLAQRFGYTAVPWQMNPNLCNRCEQLVKKHEVGVEVEVTMLFADVRGSTPLAERLGPAEFRHLIDRFYRVATRVLLDGDALIENLIGDEVAGLFVPGLAGPDFTLRAIAAAQELLEATGHGSSDGPWVEVGAGVHTGRAYVGAVGSDQSVSIVTVLGEAANTTARLASAAGAGEVLVSDSARARAVVSSSRVRRDGRSNSRA